MGLLAELDGAELLHHRELRYGAEDRSHRSPSLVACGLECHSDVELVWVAIEFARRVEEAGLDYFAVSGGAHDLSLWASSCMASAGPGGGQVVFDAIQARLPVRAVLLDPLG